MSINHKNIYNKGTKLEKDLVVKHKIEETFKVHPSYGHRRVAIELKMNHKKILRIMHEFHLKPPRLWYQKRFTTRSNPAYYTQYTNVLKDTSFTDYSIGEEPYNAN